MLASPVNTQPIDLRVNLMERWAFANPSLGNSRLYCERRRMFLCIRTAVIGFWDVPATIGVEASHTLL
jgi:hypothetical protein